MDENTSLLREIRDLLLLLAEPAIAQRDERLRTSLRQIVGKSKRKADAVALMDGTRAQGVIQKQCGIDAGDLSRLVKAMREGGLLAPDDKQVKLAFPTPPDFLETLGKDNG